MTLDKSNWQPATFGEVCRNVNDNERDPIGAGIERYVGLEHIEPENLHLRSWGNVADGTTFTKVFRPGHVLFGKRRAYQKKAALADFTGLCSGDILVLEPNPEVIDPDFFPFLVQSDRFFDFAVQTSAGSLSPRTKFQDLAQFQFFLPPKDQQARLAELLWAGDDSLQRYLNLLNVILNLKEILRESLVFQGLNKNIKLKSSPLGKIAAHWEVKHFGSVIEVFGGLVDPKKEPYSNMVQIGPEHIESNTGRILEMKTAKELGMESSKFLFDEDCVIYSKIRPYLKKVAVPGFQGLCSADVYPLKSKFGNVSKHYLANFLLSKRFTNKILAFQNRTGMPKVNRDELNAMYISIPPIEEQKLINKYIEKVDNEIENLKDQIQYLKTVNTGILHQIFTP